MRKGPGFGKDAALRAIRISEGRGKGKFICHASGLFIGMNDHGGSTFWRNRKAGDLARVLDKG